MYDYECQECGTFTAMRPMAQFRDPCACPDCGNQASQLFLHAPAVASINPAGGATDARTKRSATHADIGHASVAHAAGCGCCVRRLPLLGARGRVFTSHGPPRLKRP